ncbi:DUF1828 domain-containing protein [Veillonella sp. R32]|uniref:DUF1828 domain-containing protein n=1 Tax=Veillonella sp. R32 TaxID=2021312 RepID=UPI00138A30FE|nr:DUF1828 domain-containing protein [Veillonella sp. R32]KAF1681442.1 hypothetical protein VER_07815 [Veillonella sp. R32]
MDLSRIENKLKESFANQFALIERRSGLYQLMIPIFHPDGDMFDIFLQIDGNNKITIVDCGLTLMRLSYTFDLDTGKKIQLLNRVVYQYHGQIDLETGIISLQSNLEQLFNNIMQYTQLVSGVLSLTLMQRKSVASIFYEKFDKYVKTSLDKYLPQINFKPLKQDDDTVVNYAFENNGKSIFLFPTSGDSKTKDAIITILSLQKASYPFTSVVVHDSYDKLSKAVQKKIMKVADKQFYDMTDFEEIAPEYFRKNLA